MEQYCCAMIIEPISTDYSGTDTFYVKKKKKVILPVKENSIVNNLEEGERN